MGTRLFISPGNGDSSWEGLISFARKRIYAVHGHNLCLRFAFSWRNREFSRPETCCQWNILSLLGIFKVFCKRGNYASLFIFEKKPPKTCIQLRMYQTCTYVHCIIFKINIIIIIITCIYNAPFPKDTKRKLLPLVTGPISFIPIIFLSSLERIQPHYVQPFGATGLINNLYPHRYRFILLGEEKQLQSSVLLRDTSTTVAARIRTHILTTQPSEHKSDALIHLFPFSRYIINLQIYNMYNTEYKNLKNRENKM